jgi:hypothetical protein
MKCLTELTWCWLGTRRTGLPLPPEGAKQCYIFKLKFIIFLSFVNRCTFVLRNLWAAGEKIRMKSSDIHILKRLCHKCYFKYWGRDDHPRIAAGRTSNKENVAFQRVNLRIVNDLTRRRKIMLEWRGQDGAPRYGVLGVLKNFFNFKVLANEKRGGLKVVAFDKSTFKLFTLKFSRESVQAPSCKRL